MLTFNLNNLISLLFKPSPGLESRPDRILVSTDLQVTSAALSGHGDVYKQQYNSSIYWSRLRIVIQSSWLSYKGVSGYPCRHDCGPHGSCQCGICVAVGNKHDCNLPNCSYCDSQTFSAILGYSVPCVACVLHLLFAVVSVLTVAAGSYGDTVFSILGYKCCLFNPRLFRTYPSQKRAQKLLKFCNKWPFFRLPPCGQLVTSLLLCAMCLFYVRHRFAHVLDLAANILPEELFPSDHLMLTATIT